MCLSLYAEPMENPKIPSQKNSPSSQKTFGGCRLLLVDGSNLMFQMFYGMPSRIVNKQGVAIHGVLGFVGAFLRIVGLVEPTHILVVFDGEHENPRVLLDDQYKANRPDFSAMQEEETPFSQMPYIYDALDHMGVKCFETVHFEADDVINAMPILEGFISSQWAITLSREPYCAKSFAAVLGPIPQTPFMLSLVSPTNDLKAQYKSGETPNRSQT